MFIFPAGKYRELYGTRQVNFLFFFWARGGGGGGGGGKISGGGVGF